MFNQKLKKFYSLLMPGRKASSASNTENLQTASPDSNNDNNLAARILYRGDNARDNTGYEKNNAAEHDWWIN